jgi:lipid II:glycine glycyltransferase (peptidoglycan interpeptide bridge formation enzyme)
MLLRSIREEERAAYDAIVQHPLQSWAWGEFRKQTGVQVERVGFFEEGKLQKAFQVFFHPIPHYSSMTIGYFPRGYMPDEEQLNAVRQIAKRHNAVFVKLEPNVAQKVENVSAHSAIADFLIKNGCTPGRPLFTKYTFQMGLRASEDELFSKLNSKTRYNVNLAFKKGVQIYENTSAEGMEQYVQILEETTQRQGFYAHKPEYFRKMWEHAGNSGMLRIFNAVYENQVLVSWVMFVFNKKLYYPYGASRSAFREVMPSNLMMWEMIKFGKSEGCELFDMWGSLGPMPDEKDAWFGFHRFKKGFGGDLVEFLGTYDLVINPPAYSIYRLVENIRWKFLRFKTKLRK